MFAHSSPFAAQFMITALGAGLLAAVLCAIVGTWVVARGMAFLGEAVGHGMLPGVALATVAGWPVVLGGALSAAAMSTLVAWLRRRGKLSHDTSIGLAFAGMLSLGVIIVSFSGSFATDATAMLFGDILAVRPSDVVVLVAALGASLCTVTLLHRSFLAASLDERLAQSLGLRPSVADGVLTALVTVAVVASYPAVGSLLAVALLVAPAAAARLWARRIPSTMALAAVVGALSVFCGLGASWYLGTAAGASIALSSVLMALFSSLARFFVDLGQRRSRKVAS